jgi:hypothetical protein
MELVSKGFYEIVPKRLVKIFNSNDLQLIICGLETLEISNWKENTVYKNCTDSTLQVRWFWRAVKGFDNESRVKLLQLVTGSTRLLIKEFGHVENDNLNPFTVCMMPPSFGKQSLPIINTWFG